MTTLSKWVAVLALLRTLRIYEYGGWEVAVVWALSALAAWRWRRAHGILALDAAVSAATFVPHNGVTSIAWLAAAVYLFDGDDRRAALRVLGSSIYAFTAVNKMFPAFASGAIIAAKAPWMPFPQLVAAATIYAEFTLAIALWRRWPATFWMAVAFHTGILVIVPASPAEFFNLVAWQMTMPLIAWHVTGRHTTAQSRLPSWTRRPARNSSH